MDTRQLVAKIRERAAYFIAYVKNNNTALNPLDSKTLDKMEGEIYALSWVLDQLEKDKN